MHALRWIVVVVSAVAAACAGPGPSVEPDGALQLSEVAMQGDATRQASLRLVIEGLGADQRGEAQRARGMYARSLQVESGNPYAYLALARHHADQGDADLVREHAARCRDLFVAVEPIPPRVAVHLIGLRGIALALDGREEEADRLLARAASLAPSVWGDGRLSAAELR